MERDVGIIRLEMVVDDLDRAVELFGDVLGCEVVTRAPATLVAGEMAVIDAGAIVINLLCPADGGDGTILAERTPRLSQLILGVGTSDTVAALHERCVDLGLAVGGDHLADAPGAEPERRFYLTPECVEGAIGQPAAIVVTALA